MGREGGEGEGRRGWLKASLNIPAPLTASAFNQLVSMPTVLVTWPTVTQAVVFIICLPTKGWPG